MSKLIKWGIMSTAAIGQSALIPAIVAAADNEVVAISSSSIEKAQGVASKFNIPKAYGSYKEMLHDSEIDAVYIPLPNHLHSEWVKKAADAGKHILCEKPAALNAEEAIDMIDFCKKKNVVFMEAFMYQFHPQHQRVKDIIAAGEIGEMKIMRSSFTFYMNPDDRGTNIRTKLEMGGGSVYDVGSYCLNAIRDILNSEPAKIFAQAEIDPIHQIDMVTTSVIELKNGVRAVFDSSFDASFNAGYVIVGTKGMIEAPRAFRADIHNGEGIIIVKEKNGVIREEKIIGHQYTLQVEHFADCIREGKEPIYTGNKTIQNMKAIDAVYESIKKGAVIEL
jgi:xylose dehydrogenase (NAD/NADP)